MFKKVLLFFLFIKYITSTGGNFQYYQMYQTIKYTRSNQNLQNPVTTDLNLKNHTSKTLISQRSGSESIENEYPVEKHKQQQEGSFCRRSFDGNSGYCLLANQCIHVLREHRLHGVKIDICTYRKKMPVICCPLADKDQDNERISAKKCREYNDALNQVKINSIDEFSGKLCVASIPMIVGGEITQKEEYPHMAALGWTQADDDNDIRWDCGGTLISEKFILTAAHCITSKMKPPDFVRLGTANLNVTKIGHFQDYQIVTVILHPKHVPTTLYHDLALLKLAKHVEFSTSVRPACLWLQPEMKIKHLIASGWGRIDFIGPQSYQLQKVDLDLIEQKLCKDLYRTDRRLPRGIIDEQLCAGHLIGGKDTCQGDSGGPLHVEIPEFKCVKFIVGITSFGKICGAPNAPGVYTKVYAYLDWIEKIVFADN